MLQDLFTRGLLPSEAIARSFSQDSNLQGMDQFFQQLPALLRQPDFRQQVEQWALPISPVDKEDITKSSKWFAEMQRYYLFLGFLASGYLHHESPSKKHRLPENISNALTSAGGTLNQYPNFSYNQYVLLNWQTSNEKKSFDDGDYMPALSFSNHQQEIALIKALINIEVASKVVITSIINMDSTNPTSLHQTLQQIESSLDEATIHLKQLHYQYFSSVEVNDFARYLQPCSEVHLTGEHPDVVNFPGVSPLHSSIPAILTAFLKIPHKESELTQQLNQSCQYLPVAHQKVLHFAEYIPNIKKKAPTSVYNRVLETLANFRQMQWLITESIQQSDNAITEVSTSETKAMFHQLVDETLNHKIPVKRKMKSSLEIIKGDICDLNVNAIVVPGNRNLYTGRGMIQLLFEKAGPELKQACTKIGKVKVGTAHITPAFNLPCDAIIHAVPPQWSGGDQWGCSALGLLKSSYENALDLALDNGITTLALVSLGTGANQFPHAIAAHQALEVLKRYESRFQRLIVCLHQSSSYACWMHAYEDFKYNSAA